MTSSDKSVSGMQFLCRVLPIKYGIYNLPHTPEFNRTLRIAYFANVSYYRGKQYIIACNLWIMKLLGRWTRSNLQIVNFTNGTDLINIYDNNVIQIKLLFIYYRSFLQLGG